MKGRSLDEGIFKLQKQEGEDIFKDTEATFKMAYSDLQTYSTEALSNLQILKLLVK